MNILSIGVACQNRSWQAFYGEVAMLNFVCGVGVPHEEHAYAVLQSIEVCSGAQQAFC